MVRIFCKNTGTYREFQEGTMLLDMIDEFDFGKPYDIISAKVNNVSQGLKFRVYNSRDVEFQDYTTYSGRNVYSRSLCFLLYKAALDVFPQCKVVMRRPISKGFFCSIDKGDGNPLSAMDIAAIKARMREIVEQDMPFHRHEVQISEAIELFRSLGHYDKVKLLESCGEVYISYYTLGETADYYYDVLVPSAGYLKVWDLSPYRNGAILRVPDRHHPERLAPFNEQPKTFDVFAETIRWNSIMGLDNVGDVNQACLKGKATDLIQVAEALQEKKIVQIAEEIDRRYRSPQRVRIILQEAQRTADDLRTETYIILYRRLLREQAGHAETSRRQL